MKLNLVINKCICLCIYFLFVLFSAAAALQMSLLMFMFLLNVGRDLKPTNVLLDEDDRPVLMDLGSMNRARIEVRAVTASQTRVERVTF